MSDDEQLIANVLNATARQRASQLMAQSELPAPDGYADPFDDPEYQKWLEEMAQHCRCTPQSERPCAGVCAGGLCDDMHWDDPHDEPDED